VTYRVQWRPRARKAFLSLDKPVSRRIGTGRRDHAWILLAIQTGLRAAELTSLTCADVHPGTGAYVACHGKGRNVGEPQLRTGVGALFADDDPHPFRPVRQVEHAGELGCPGALADLAVAIIGRSPRAGGDLADGVLDVVGDGEPDRVGLSELSWPVDVGAVLDG
jgi:hypothetical protein